MRAMVMGAAAGGAFVGLMMARNIATSKKGIEAAAESWKTLAAHGLTLGTETVGAFKAPTSKERPTLTGSVGGTPIDVRIETDMVHLARTEITAKRAAPFDGVVGVHPSPGGVLGYLRSWIGQDLLVGDEPFDAAYLITGKPESAPKELLVEGVRQLVAGLGDKLAGFTVEGDTARVVLAGAEADAEIVLAAIHLAIAGATWQATADATAPA